MSQTGLPLNVSAEQIEKDCQLVLSQSQKELLDKIRRLCAPSRPDGFGFTAAEYAAEEGLKATWAREKLERLVKAGDLKKGEYIVQMPDGRGHKTFVYFDK